MVNTSTELAIRKVISAASQPPEAFEVEAPRCVPQVDSKTASRVAMGLMISLFVFNYFFTFSDMVQATLNMTITGLALLVNVYVFAKSKTKDWQELAKKVLLFGAIFAVSLFLGFNGTLAAATQRYVVLIPLLAYAGYAIHKKCSKG